MDERVLNSMFDSAQQRHASGEKMKFTEDEANKFKKAFADPEFRQMFAQYMDELQDPSHREETEAYISQLESEQKVPEGKELIRPRAGFVAKTYKTMDGAADPDKVFLNIVQSEKVIPPSRTRSAKGDNWSVPYTVGPPHMEKDKKGENAACFDCCFHPEALELASSNRDFKDLLVNTAMDGVEEMFTRQGFKAKLDRKFHIVKGMTYKEGQVLTMMIASTSKSSWTKPTPATPAAPAASSAASSAASPPPPPAKAASTAAATTAATTAVAASNVTSSSGKKGRKDDPPASAADEEGNTAAVPPTAPPTQPKKAPASTPAIKKGFLTSSKTAIYADKVPTIRPSGGDKGLVQEVQGLRAEGVSNHTPASPSPSPAADLKAISTKKVSRPVVPAPSPTPAAVPAESAPASGPVKPVVVVKHSAALSLGDFDGLQRQQVASARPSELVYEVHLPLLESTAGMALDLSEHKLLLACRDLYRLDLDLPYRVHDQRAKASFDKHKRVLTVRLPVVQATTPVAIEEADGDVSEEVQAEDAASCDKPAVPPRAAKAATGKEHARWVSSPSSGPASGEKAVETAEGSRSLQEEVRAQAALAKQRAAEMVGKAPPRPPVAASPSPAPAPVTGPFLSCASFAGARPGYVFRNGDQGVGYYRDTITTVAAPDTAVPAAPSPTVAAAATAAAASRESPPCAIPFEVQETPKAVALLLQVPRVVAQSVKLDVTRFGIDVSFEAIVDADASSPQLQRYAQGFTLDEARCPGGLDARSAKFDAAGKNAVVVICKEKPDEAWETDGEGDRQSWMRTRSYAGAAVEDKSQGFSAMASGMDKLTLTASSPPASAAAQRGEAKPVRSQTATQTSQSVAAATVSAMQFNADILSELD